MLQHRDVFDSERCPIPERLLGEMYRASEHGLAELVGSVSSDVRAMLALFCYRRSHLQGLACAIAATCDERELIQFGGRAGGALYQLAKSDRNAASVPALSARKTITLSSKPLSSLPPLDQDDDDEIEAQPAA